MWPLRSPAEELVEQARTARERGEFRLAGSLLDEAEAEAEPPADAIQHERGLLARDRGQLEAAVRLLHQSAEAEPESDARLDHAGTLVQLGRWPEAVVVLRRAFEERGYLLRVDDVVADPRFVKLAGFAPYQALIDRERIEQAGPLAKLVVTLERIDTTSHSSAVVLERFSGVVSAVWRVAMTAGAPVILLILTALLLTFGVAQLGLVKPPWTLVLGMAGAAGLWHTAARIASDGTANGWVTIGVATGAVFVPWLVLLSTRWLMRWRRTRVGAGIDPFARDQLPQTLAVVEQVAQVGRRWLETEGPEREEAARELRLARDALRNRLGIEEE
jgi:tetratricopeptide (TPR) repeat protein